MFATHHKSRGCRRIYILFAVSIFGCVAPFEFDSGSRCFAQQNEPFQGFAERNSTGWNLVRSPDARLASFHSGKRNSDGIRLSGRTMGPVPYNITVYEVPAEVSQEEIAKRISSTLERVNRLMSTYINDSDVSRFNAYRGTDWFEIDAETALVIARSLEISLATEGAFDVSVGPLVRAWNFGPEKKEQFAPPAADELESIMRRVGYQKIAVQVNPPAVKKSVPDLEIDLSAIAKGYAVDCVLESLLQLGCRSVMVEVGGEVRISGNKPSGTKWRLGINDPEAVNTNKPFAVFDIVDRSMATSGDYRSFYFKDGKRYSHMIDPRTGKPVVNAMTSASVICEDCMTADAWATALMILGEDAGRNLILKSQQPIEYYFLLRNENPRQGSDRYRVVASGGFPDVVLESVTQEPKVEKSNFWPVLGFAMGGFVLMLIAMSVGVIFSNRRIKGSCGGIANLQKSQGEEVACSMCSNPSDQCKELRDAMKAKMAEDGGS